MMGIVEDSEDRRKIRIAAMSLAIRGLERMHVIDCDACRAHNLVDAAKIIALHVTPRCARCRATLHVE